MNDKKNRPFKNDINEKLIDEFISILSPASIKKLNSVCKQSNFCCKIYL